MPWARDSVRGSPSSEIAVTPRSASDAGQVRVGQRREHADHRLPGAQPPPRPLGRVTVRMTSAVAYRSSVLVTVAPAAV